MTKSPAKHVVLPNKLRGVLPAVAPPPSQPTSSGLKFNISSFFAAKPAAVAHTAASTPAPAAQPSATIGVKFM